MSWATFAKCIIYTCTIATDYAWVASGCILVLELPSSLSELPKQAGRQREQAQLPLYSFTRSRHPSSELQQREVSDLCIHMFLCQVMVVDREDFESDECWRQITSLLGREALNLNVTCCVGVVVLIAACHRRLKFHSISVWSCLQT